MATFDEVAFSLIAVKAKAKLLASNERSSIITSLHLLEALATVPGTEAYWELERKGCREKIISEIRKRAPKETALLIGVRPKDTFDLEKLRMAVRSSQGEMRTFSSSEIERQRELSIESTSNVESALETKKGSFDTKSEAPTGRVLQNLRLNRGSAAGILLWRLEPSWKLSRASQNLFTSNRKEFHAAAGKFAAAVTSAATTFLNATVGNFLGTVAGVAAIAQSIGDFTLTFSQEDTKAQDGLVSYHEYRSEESQGDLHKVLVIVALKKTSRTDVRMIGTKKHVLELVMMLSVMVPRNEAADDVCQSMLDEYGNKVADYLRDQVLRFAETFPPEEKVACVDAVD